MPYRDVHWPEAMQIHLIDGTYELFRQFYGRLRFARGEPPRLGAVAGVLHSVLEMIEGGARYLGVATDHVVESFRNELWAGYKTGEGLDPRLWEQFHPLEDALAAMGVTVWAMRELEADDGLASAARIAAADSRVERVSIWTPDKDLAQCVRGTRVVQVDRRSGTVRDAEGVREKFGVVPERIPDFLALVGDSADGFPGIRGIGKVTAGRLIEAHGPIESFPDDVLGERRADALLFKQLATLRTDVPLVDDVRSLAWAGPSEEFEDWVDELQDERLGARAREAWARFEPGH